MTWNIYIIEIKIGDPQEKIIQGLAQALKYAKDNDTNNVIVINYPDSIRTEDIENINTKALTTITNTFSSTYYMMGGSGSSFNKSASIGCEVYLVY